MLFRLECKKIFRSLSYIIYCILLVLFTGSQYFPDTAERVTVNEEGYKIVEDHDLIMEGALNSLFGAYAANNYICYPFGFYKAVHLKEKKQDEIKEYLKLMTGTDDEEFSEMLAGGKEYYFGMNDMPEYEFDTITIADGFDYDRFVTIMSDIDDMLGGGSDYAPDSLTALYSRVPMTYEESCAVYDDFIEKDRVTGGLARYFCDYAGIALAIVPVFVAAMLTAADRKRRMNELVYTRSISSFRLVFTRYAALVFTMFIPLFLEMAAALLFAMKVYSGEDIDMAVMFTLPTFWLLPILMFTAALGMLITEMFSPFMAILVQLVVWFRSVMSGSFVLYGQIGKFDLVCRHNTELARDEFLMNQSNFVFSRIFWTVISLAVVVIAVYVYDSRRGGRFNGIRLFGEGSLLRRKA